MVSRVIPVDPFDLVIFGGTGDLARRKILPGLYRRHLDGQMPEDARIIGAARGDMDTDGYRVFVESAVREFVPKKKCNPKVLKAFLERLRFVQLDATGKQGWPDLKDVVRQDVVQAFSGQLLNGFTPTRSPGHPRGSWSKNRSAMMKPPRGH